MNSSEVGRSRLSATTVNVPSPLTLTSSPVFGTALLGSIFGSTVPCERGVETAAAKFHVDSFRARPGAGSFFRRERSDNLLEAPSTKAVAQNNRGLALDMTKLVIHQPGRMDRTANFIDGKMKGRPSRSGFRTAAITISHGMLLSHENEPDRSIQRWRYRHSHYHHGFGVEGPARSDASFPGENVADLFCLCPELRHPRDLLGQSSSPYSPRDPGRFGLSLGKHESAFLDLAHPLGHGLPWRQSCTAISGSALCRGVGGGSDFFFPAARVNRSPSSRTRVQAVEQKNGAQKSYRDSHLHRGYRRRVHLHATRPGHDRVAGNNVFPAGTFTRETRAPDLISVT